MSAGNYTQSEITAALTAGQRVSWGAWEVFRRQEGTSKGFLVGVEPGSRIGHEYLADIKGTCALSVRENPGTALQDDEVNWSGVDVEHDVIVPWWYLQMPDGGYAEWRKGTFIMEAGERGKRSGGGVFRQINGSDLSILLFRDAATATGFYQLPTGTNVIAHVKILLAQCGIFTYALSDSTYTLPGPRLWEQGTSQLVIVNDLLKSVGYGSLFFDDAGVARAAAYTVPAKRPTTHVYSDDSASVLYPEASDTLDVFDVPNRWVTAVSQSDRDPLISVFDNLSPTSPTSQVSRGYILSDFQTTSNATTQAALDTETRQRAHETSMVYRHVTINTLTMPDHGEADIVELTDTALGINRELYEEVSWSMCNDQPGQGMTHELRKVVDVDLTS